MTSTETNIGGYSVTVFTGYYGTQLFITDKAGIEIYAHKVSGDPMERAMTIIARAENKTVEQFQKLLNAKDALESAHIQSVEVDYEYEFDGVRVYSVVTYDTRIPHHYTVKVWEEDNATVAKCNCVAHAECRHIGKVALEDASRSGRRVNVESFTKYKAHKQARRLAA